jgi:hypothetical protein
MRLLVLAAMVGLMTAPPVAAIQDDTIVVTGSRVSRASMRQARTTNAVPHIHIVRRADNYLVTVEVFSDTREREDRRAEVSASLETLLAAADGNSAITVAMMGDGLVDLDPGMIDQIEIREHGNREDVSTVTLYLKTPVRADDDFDDADNRIKNFVDALAAPGRAEINPSSSYSLTITDGADQYRNQVVQAIASDVRFLRTTFGSDYEIVVTTSLHERVRLVQSGPLDLSIYLPYTTSIALRDDD